MSTKKLRTKLGQVRHLLPLKRARSPTGAGLSEKMLKPIDNTADALATPPPPPPKDYGSWNDVRYAIDAAPLHPDAPLPSPPASPHVIFLARQIKHTPSYTKLPPLPSDANVDEHGMYAPPSPTVPPKPSRARTASSRIPIATVRASLPLSPAQRRAATISTPEEAELRRREAQRRKEREEAEALREEAERQARLKREKEALLAQFALEEAERKAALEAELRRAAEDRRRREAIEREAAAMESMLAAERKRQERERRRAETEKLQQWRRELEQRNMAQAQERAAWRERVDAERRELAKGLSAKRFKTERGIVVLLTGWVTVQSEDCLSWKRRYFQLCEKELVLFKDAEDNSQPLETFAFTRIQRIQEWQEGYEELEPIPNSFALELKGQHDARSMFTDTTDDKENLLALLSSKLSTR